MSRPETHRIFNNRVDIGARFEAEKILTGRIADTEDEINRLFKQVKRFTETDDENSLQRISNVSEQAKELVKKLGLLSTKLYRLRHEKTRFGFFDVCPSPDHRNVLIAGETHKESAEDRSIIIKEVLVARRLANGESVTNIDNFPSLKMVCVHPRSAKDIAFDLRHNHTVRGWFSPQPPPKSGCSRNGTRPGRPKGLAASRKRRMQHDDVVDDDKPYTELAGGIKRIHILKRE